MYSLKSTPRSQGGFSSLRLFTVFFLAWKLMGWSYPPSEQELRASTRLAGKGSRCDEMRSAERRQEVVNCRFVCQVDSCQARTPLVTVVVKQAIVADAQAATQVIQGEKLFDLIVRM